MENRILVATDGSPQSVGALRVARALSDRASGTVRVLSVYESLELLVGAADVIPSLPLRSGREVAAALREAVRGQLAEVGGGAEAWPVEVVAGAPAPTIVRQAAAHGTSVIVLGLGHHSPVDRWLGGETALKVMHLAHVPVLAVPEHARALPRRAVVAMDFSEFSLNAARGAIRVLAPGGELHLAHVLAPFSEEFHARTGGDDWLSTYRVGLETRLLELRQEIAASAPGIRVSKQILEGNPARELLAFAERIQADVIATGSHGYGFLGRVVMGSVSTRLVRAARCAVLIAPPRTVPEEIRGVEDEMLTTSQSR